MKVKPGYILAAVVAGAFVLRLVGVGYGLPLWAVNDEPSYISGTLKMLESQAFIPALRPEVFQSTLYYPPFLLYLYLLLFLPVLGVQLLLGGGSLADLTATVAADPSSLFLAARLANVAMGAAAVWLVYYVGRNLYGRASAGLAAAALLGSSYLHTVMSHWAKHWAASTLAIVAVLYCLTHPTWSQRRRYLWAAAAAGLGVGINYEVGIAAALIAMWLLLHERMPLRVALRQRWAWGSAALFVALAAVAVALYPHSFTSNAAEATRHARGLVDAAQTLWYVATRLALAEPLLTIALVAGVIAAWKLRRGLAWITVGFSALYLAVLYLGFFIETRFLLGLYPLWVIIGAGGVVAIASRIRTSWKPWVAAAALALPVAVLIRTDVLLIRNDTRAQAARWIGTLPRGAKVATLVPLGSYPTSPEGVVALREIDPAALRQRDVATETLSSRGLPTPQRHVLNLATVTDPAFFSQLQPFLAERGYSYLLYDPQLLHQRTGASQAPGVVTRTFAGYESLDQSVIEGLGEGIPYLLSLPSNGPTLIANELP